MTASTSRSRPFLRSQALVLALALEGCRLLDQVPPSPPDAAPEGRRVVDEGGDGGGDGGARPEPAQAHEFPRDACVHQRRADLGAPVHRERGGKGGFVRLAECTRLTLIEGDARWLRASFPLVEGLTEGWISGQYVMDGCEACADRSGGAPPDVGWPPQPRGSVGPGGCVDAAATGRERVRPGDAPDVAAAGGGAKGLAGSRVLVVSWNVWELYDGVGEDRYLADEHGGTPAAQYERRLALFAKTLGRLEADVLLLQEVEGAAVACALAHEAWPRSGWSCASGRGAAGGGGVPQNVAVATRLRGDLRWLSPDDHRTTGPRGALELSLEGAGGLTVTAVHLKSSVGQYGAADCANARQRMGAAAALATRYGGWSSVLIAGDFNVDPHDTGRALYDRTADVLLGRGFERLCAAEGAGCAVATYQAAGGRGRDGAIDLAFFRGGGRWRAERLRVITTAPRRTRSNPLASDHLPIEVELRQ
jgi:endonuclease/exonuclease/phosphatase family metal-dependent hydrolase